MPHRVVGDRITDVETGKEVLWRGAGGSYFLHATSLEACLTAWQNLYIPLAKQAGFNTMRLAFKFSWDTLLNEPVELRPGADDLDYTKMDAVVNLLAQNGIKSILDYHGSQPQMFKKVGFDGSSALADIGDPVNPLLLQSWQEMASYYIGNPNIVAYEIYNEPTIAWGSTPGVSYYRSTPRRNAEGYNELTNAVRQIDPDHICIWETPAHYIADFADILGLMLSNVVYTAHRWWTGGWEQIKLWGAYITSMKVFDSLVTWRKLYNIPMWLGEFGGPGGGNPNAPYPGLPNQEEWRKLQWEICGELLWRSEEQVISWNLWLGTLSTTTNKLLPYMPLLPPMNLNVNLVRQPFIMVGIPKLTEYVIDSKGVDVLGDYEIHLWHNSDYVTFKPGIVIRVLEYQKDAEGKQVLRTDNEIMVSEQTTIQNIEGSVEHPGDWNTVIMTVRFIRKKYLFHQWQDGDASPTKTIQV